MYRVPYTIKVTIFYCRIHRICLYIVAIAKYLKLIIIFGFIVKLLKLISNVCIAVISSLAFQTDIVSFHKLNVPYEMEMIKLMWSNSLLSEASLSI